MSQLADIYVNASMALELYNFTHDAALLPVMDACLRDVMTHWHPGLRLFTESAGIGAPAWHLPEGRLVCVGSVFEIAWFLLRILEHRPDPLLQTRLVEAVQSALDYGWDAEFGGFYYFQDLAGKPTLQLESNMKLWWVHAEALCCLVHCWTLTREDRWLRWLERVEDYCFRHFADPQYGEWFGYLDRRGQPTHTLKGNNYKGCFHIPRALLLSIQKLEQAGV